MSHRVLVPGFMLLACAYVSTGCTPEPPAAEPAAEASATSGSEAPASPFVLPVNVTLAGEPFSCAGAGDSVMTPTELMLFAHDFEWVAADGHRTPATLVDDAAWQTERLVLLDFAGESAGCHDASAAQNEQIVFQGGPAADAVALAFRIGVPFELNHADPTRLSGPLTLMQMHWGWRGGYKFLRLEGRAQSDDVLLHLGSTGCTGPMTAIEACAHGGQLQVEVPWNSSSSLRLELLPLLDESLLAGHRCMGVDGEGLQNCTTAWRALGDPASGVWSTDSTTQSEAP